MLPSAEKQPLALEILELKFAEGWQVNPGKNLSVFAQSFYSPTDMHPWRQGTQIGRTPISSDRAGLFITPTTLCLHANKGTA